MQPLRCACCVCFQKSGIEKLIPNMMIDDFLFEPCGYSMNGISNKNVSIFFVCFKLFCNLFTQFCMQLKVMHVLFYLHLSSLSQALIVTVDNEQSPLWQVHYFIGQYASTLNPDHRLLLLQFAF